MTTQISATIRGPMSYTIGPTNTTIAKGKPSTLTEQEASIARLSGFVSLAKAKLVAPPPVLDPEPTEADFPDLAGSDEEGDEPEEITQPSARRAAPPKAQPAKKPRVVVKAPAKAK